MTENKKMKIVIGLPAFNEEKPITDVIKKSLNYVDKVVVCDDGSGDLTSERAKNAGAVVITHDKNLGKGAAMKSLFEYAKDVDADIIVTIDGDGQFLPEQMESLIEPILENNYDLVIGNRFANDKEMQWRQILKPGQLLIFNNWRVLHGRSEFSGKRKMSGCYINKEDFEFQNNSKAILAYKFNKVLDIRYTLIKIIYMSRIFIGLTPDSEFNQKIIDLKIQY